MARPEILAVVADYDGTLVWNGRKAWKVYVAVCQESGVVPPTFEEYRFKYSHGPFPANLRTQGVSGTEEELRFLVAKFWDSLPASRLAKGAWNMLVAWQAAGIPLGLATRLYTPFAERSIRKRHLDQFFSPHIYTGLEEKTSVLQKLSFACGPERLLFLTDTVPDIREAKSVGCVVGACTRGHGHPLALGQEDPDFLFGSWRELPEKVAFKKL